jgi:hypothetical protein
LLWRSEEEVIVSLISELLLVIKGEMQWFVRIFILHQWYFMYYMSMQTILFLSKLNHQLQQSIQEPKNITFRSFLTLSFQIHSDQVFPICARSLFSSSCWMLVTAVAWDNWKTNVNYRLFFDTITNFHIWLQLIILSPYSKLPTTLYKFDHNFYILYLEPICIKKINNCNKKKGPLLGSRTQILTHQNKVFIW